MPIFNTGSEISQLFQNFPFLTSITFDLLEVYLFFIPPLFDVLSILHALIQYFYYDYVVLIRRNKFMFKYSIILHEYT